MTTAPGLAAIKAVARRALPGPPVSPRARVALHFHPDVDLWGEPVLERIVADGTYRSQFATGTSNGGLTAVRDGDRWRWEHRIFDGAYDDTPQTERPVYGALAIDDDPYGPAPRFGSAYLRLRPGINQRSTFAYPDSTFEPTAFGLAGRCGLVELWRGDRPPDPLNHYVEAHVHGPVRIPVDVEALVLDPSFRDTDLEAIARRSGLPVEWHPGYVLTVDRWDEIADYRGPATVDLVRALMVDGILTPAIQGRSRRGGHADPQLQKWAWHCLARFGRVLG